MLTGISPFSSQIRTPSEPVVKPDLALSGKAAEELKALAEAYHLSEKGTLALTQWTCWLSYATAQSKTLHLTADPGWKLVLPIDKKHAQEHLYQLLLRAGEPQDTALETAMACYPFMYAPILESRLLPRPLKCVQRPQDGIADFAAKDLPAHAVPFASLPAWAREVALFATDLTGKSLAGVEGLNGLDLSHLSAYGTDFSDRDLRNSDFSHTDMRRANTSRAYVDGNRMQGAITTPIDAPTRQFDGSLERSYPRPSLFDPAQGVMDLHKVEKEDFLHDREILQVLPIASTRQAGGIDIGYTADGKSIIQQQTVWGSSAAASAMLIADQGGEIDVEQLSERGYADDKQVQSDIAAAGMRPVTWQAGSVGMLADRLAAKGPAIISLDDEIRGHHVIVDTIDLTRHVARLRDPHHGWAVVVPLVSFTSRWRDPNPVITQIALPDPESISLHSRLRTLRP